MPAGHFVPLFSGDIAGKFDVWGGVPTVADKGPVALGGLPVNPGEWRVFRGAGAVEEVDEMVGEAIAGLLFEGRFSGRSGQFLSIPLHKTLSVKLAFGLSSCEG